MDKHTNANSFNKSMRHKKSKRRAHRRFVKAVLCLCCFVMLLAAAFRFFKYESPSPVNDTEESTWSLILVNKWNYIPDNYKVELTELKNGESVDKRIYPALQKMFDDARKDHVYPVAASGYRTAEKQQELMDEKIAAYESEGYSADEAKSKAEAWVAIPGTSEHQLGLSVDINADGIRSTGDDVYEWLHENSYKYGFIYRYPENKTDITGVINEPWHYRYVGTDAAAKIHELDICLEEYLELQSEI